MIRLRRLGGGRGQVLVIFALSAVALFAVVALAIDGGRMLIDQRALQNAADGAALLAASDVGPGADSGQRGQAEDDAVLAVERSLAIDFSNNYVGKAHRLIGGAGSCSPPAACSPPWSPTACCTNWADTTGSYLFTIVTPKAFGSAEPEAVVQVRLVHHMSLMIGGSLWPQIDVSANSTARNYAIPYAIFTFKHNDNTDLDQTGSAFISANKRVGSNGTASRGSITFTCTGTAPGQWGGDYHSFSAGNGVTLNGTKENTCAAPAAATNVVFGPNVANYILPPTVHLPDDPCLLSPNPCGAAQAVQGALTVSGTQMLTPTIPADPTRPLGPRYSTVTVQGNGNVLYLQPGVYFFEGTATGSGLRITSQGTVVTGDCYAAGGPTFPNCSSTAVCGQAMTPLVAGADSTFRCGTANDMGVLLVFWPAGAAVDPACVPLMWPLGNASYPYCTATGTSGAYNQLQVQSGANLYVSSTARYHSVVVFVDPKHATSSWNFTLAATLPAGFTTQTDAGQLGNGSNVVYTQGGGSISVVGATFAPQDNAFLGGASSGKGFGQVLAYWIHYQGNAAITESYNPLALVYAPVLLQ
jgi:Putative Flp pilus-assembly TadE/G-like